MNVRINDYFILKRGIHISGCVSPEQKDKIKKMDSKHNKRNFLESLNDIEALLNEYDRIYTITHNKIINHLEKNDKIIAQKIFPVGFFPLALEKYLIGNKYDLSDWKVFYYVKLTKNNNL